MTEQSQNRLVWTEIPVSDLARAKKFYATVLEEALIDNNEGPDPMAMLPYSGGQAAAGHLYPGKSAAEGEGITVHLTVAGDLDKAMDRVRLGGGKVVSDVISIPAGSFFYAIDTEGNSVGFFKA